MGNKPRTELMNAMHELFIDSTYSDLTITCGTDEHHVHRAIVCPRSEFFAAACGSGFKEARTAKISLPHDDPQCVTLILHYLYHLDYPHVSMYGEDETESAEAEAESEKAPAQAPATVDEITPQPDPEIIQVDPLAGLFGSAVPEVPGPSSSQNGDLTGGTSMASPLLSKLDKKKKKLRGFGTTSHSKNNRGHSLDVPKDTNFWGLGGNHFQDHVPTVPFVQSTNLIIHAKVYALADKYGIRTLKGLALDKFRDEAGKHHETSDFCQASYEAYTSTPESDRGLRNIVIETLFKHSALLDKNDIQSSLQELPLAYDLLQYSRKTAAW